jgi:toxin YoeB
MELALTDKAKDDLKYWKKSGNTSVQIKISQLINSILATPYEGAGRPEPLKYELSGTWSRRINKEHRIVYEIEENTIIILSLRGHYE